jgi:putative ABC transport system ATP-binding protein
VAEIDGMDKGDPVPAEATTPEVVAELDEASKVFGSGELEVVALHPGDLVLRAGELVLIAGPSGSGKTTVLSLLGCVLSPTTGRVRIRGEDVSGLSSKELAALRLDCVGFVFQEFNLVEPLPAGENVALPLLLAGLPRAQRKKRAREALAVLGLADRVDSYPRALSGGQKQRVAIARALVTDPLLVLCDEPTAALDHASSDVVMDKLLSLARQGRAVAVVSHDLRLTAWADRVVEMIDGRITGERPGEAPHVPKEGLAATRSGR